jgi:hypothetical protein
MQHQVLVDHVKYQHMMSSLSPSSSMHLMLLEGTLHFVQRSDLPSCWQTQSYLHDTLVTAAGWQLKALQQQLTTLQQFPALPMCAKPAHAYP